MSYPSACLGSDSTYQTFLLSLTHEFSFFFFLRVFKHVIIKHIIWKMFRKLATQRILTALSTTPPHCAPPVASVSTTGPVVVLTFLVLLSAILAYFLVFVHKPSFLHFFELAFQLLPHYGLGLHIFLHVLNWSVESVSFFCDDFELLF